MTEAGEQAAGQDAPPHRPSSVRAWLREGGRTLFFRAPHWDGLAARPATLAGLLAAVYLLALVLQWAMLEGTPRFYWQGALGGWASVAVMAWLCWVVARSRESNGLRDGPTAATLQALTFAASVVYSLVHGAVQLGFQALGGPADETWTHQSLWLVLISWLGLTRITLLWRVAADMSARAAILLLVPATLALSGWLSPILFWWPDPDTESEASADAYKGLPLNEATLAAQPKLLADALGTLKPPQPGRVNVFALTYAPYASEDVFMRESAVVAKAMRERFGAEGRVVELVMNPATATTLPWALPGNLRQAITHTAALMDREHDVLFLHLTSHGGADGKLAAYAWPLEADPLTPRLLKAWLDEAGVRWRVISVSACYSGSWIAPLAGDGTLVMTAADADHTSYGCGRKSELTFFGRAMYVDTLYQTRSFIDAHAQARKLIDAREKEAGKKDGYSNPQISVGKDVGPVLKRLEAEQNANAPGS